MINQASQFAQIETLFQAALAAVNPETAVSQNLTLTNQTLHIGNQTVPLTENGRLFLISVGKASVPMAKTAVSILSHKLYKGIIITKEGAPAPQFPHNIQLAFGSHPVATQKSINATQQIKTLLQETTADDQVICLISGGASALLTAPLLPLSDWQTLNSALLKSGCTINEFNAVRRQLDEVKGGGLANWASPAPCHSLILSDVIGNDLAAIGSGPTYFIEESPQRARDILQTYALDKQLDSDLFNSISELMALPKQQTAVSPTNQIISDISKAAQACAKSAQLLGYTPQILTTYFEGEARELGKFVAAIGKLAPPKQCFILGGESTVTIRGNGWGGRNTETALSAAIALDGHPHITIASLATDGDDGPTKRAGAVVDGMVVRNGRKHNLDPQTYLDNNDSGTFFLNLEEKTARPYLLHTGLTGTNVNDLIIILTNDYAIT